MNDTIKKHNINYSNKKKSINKDNYNLKTLPCSVKPNYLIIPKDIDVRNIFVNMINESKKEKLNYYRVLSKEEKIERLNYLEIIKSFILNHNIKISIFLNTIFLYDILIKENNDLLSFEQLSLGALILAIKFNYDTYFNFTNKKFKFFGGICYSSEELINIELNCLQLLRYKLNYIQPINYLELFFLNGIVFTNDKILTKDSNLVYSNCLILLEEFMKTDNLYIKFNSFFICCSIISFCRGKFLLEKFPELLQIIFKINLKDFEETYLIVKDSLKNVDIKYENKRIFSSVKINKFNKKIIDNLASFNKSYNKIKFEENNGLNINNSNNNSINENKYKVFFTEGKKPIKYNNLIEKFNKSALNSHRKEEINLNKEIKSYFNENSKNDNSIQIYNNIQPLKKYNPKYFKEENKNKYSITSYSNHNPLNIKKKIAINLKTINNLNIDLNSQNERRNPSLQSFHNIRKNIIDNIDKNIALEILKKRERNLSEIVNHLYSNHRNNIL